MPLWFALFISIYFSMFLISTSKLFMIFFLTMLKNRHLHMYIRPYLWLQWVIVLFKYLSFMMHYLMTLKKSYISSCCITCYLLVVLSVLLVDLTAVKFP